jgi:hypothetical protein
MRINRRRKLFRKLPTLSEIGKNKNRLKKEYARYLQILSIKDINLRAEEIFNLYKPKGWPVGYNNLVEHLFSAEKEDVVDPLNNGFPLIQITELLHYIMKARDILEIEYKCQNCVVRSMCCDYDGWMINRMYNQCDGVQILSDRFMCFIARKYILA